MYGRHYPDRGFKALELGRNVCRELVHYGGGSLGYADRPVDRIASAGRVVIKRHYQGNAEHVDLGSVAENGVALEIEFYPVERSINIRVGWVIYVRSRDSHGCSGIDIHT